MVRLVLLLGTVALGITLCLGCAKRGSTSPVSPPVAEWGRVDGAADEPAREQSNLKTALPASASEDSEALPGELEVDEPTRERPVSASAALQPGRAQAGQALTLVIQVKTAPGWHIYAAGFSGIATPTTLELQLPDGIETAGDWTRPTAVASADGQTRIYEGSVQFRRRLRIVRGRPAGHRQVTCELGYQACDPFSCKPPETVVLHASAEIVPTD